MPELLILRSLSIVNRSETAVIMENSFFQPVDAAQVPRFAGLSTFMRLPAVPTAQGLDIALVGIFRGMAVQPTGPAPGTARAKSGTSRA